MLQAGVVFLALSMMLYSQKAALFNEFVINDDVCQHVYWMQQFNDAELFRDDLLTEYAKHYQPWGFVVFYRLLSFFMNPLLVSKLLPFLLFAVSALYIFKLGRHLAGDMAGFLAAVAFVINDYYLSRMVGGLARGFAYPLLLSFLYYLMRGRYRAASVLLVLQSLFYPMVCLVSGLTFAFSFIRLTGRRLVLDLRPLKVMTFMVALVIGGSVLFAKYVASYSPEIGRTVWRVEMKGHAEYSSQGRCRLVRGKPLVKELYSCARGGSYFNRMFDRSLKAVSGEREAEMISDAMFFVLAALFVLSLYRRKVIIPVELWALLLSGIAFFLVADLFLFKLFLPRRYLQYTASFFALFAFAVTIAGWWRGITGFKLKLAAFVLLAVLMAGGYDSSALKSNSLKDHSRNRDLYAYLESLPKDVMIATHPSSADGIPALARRKVFINYELSHTWYDRYWATVKRRTFDFFDAYYSEDPMEIYNFCRENGIDYLLVNTKHFKKDYLERGEYYFQPFNDFIRDLVIGRGDFLLADVRAEAKLFNNGRYYVINKEALSLSSLSLNDEEIY